jgi:hypothetical protein
MLASLAQFTASHQHAFASLTVILSLSAQIMSTSPLEDVSIDTRSYNTIFSTINHPLTSHKKVVGVAFNNRSIQKSLLSSCSRGPAPRRFPLKSVSAPFTLRNLIEKHFAIGLAVLDDIQQDTF